MHMTHSITSSFVIRPIGVARITAVCLCSTTSLAQECEPHWDNTIGTGGMTGHIVQIGVHALTMFDDGNGPALYAGGQFWQAGEAPTRLVAKWDGEQWYSIDLDSRSGGAVRALEAFDDGSGPALYAGGSFLRLSPDQHLENVAKWDGVAWSDVGGGIWSSVNALIVFDDGTGPALYAGGRFQVAGGQPAARIAKWDGQTWTQVGGGMNSTVHALTVFDDGTGPALYAGGEFTLAGGVPVWRLAKWDGQEWSAIGGGMGGHDTPTVLALTGFDDGTGPALYVGGSFTVTDGGHMNYIAKWNGKKWSSLSGGMNDRVRSFEVFDDGSGPALYAGGDFTKAGGVHANRIAKWNGHQWSSLGGGVARPSYTPSVLAFL